MTGQLQATAEANIVAAGLTVGTVTTAASATVPAGDVISQNPVACMACASPSDPVDLVVSTGPIDIPDACLDAWPEDTVETIGGGQSPTNNPKVSQIDNGEYCRRRRSLRRKSFAHQDLCGFVRDNRHQRFHRYAYGHGVESGYRLRRGRL